jgi:hypothetical protein
MVRLAAKPQVQPSNRCDSLGQGVYHERQAPWPEDGLLGQHSLEPHRPAIPSEHPLQPPTMGMSQPHLNTEEAAVGEGGQVALDALELRVRGPLRPAGAILVRCSTRITIRMYG